MATRYRLDPAPTPALAAGRFTVQAFATGMLSFLGHSPTFAVREFRGEIRLDHEGPGRMSVEVAVKAESLMLVNAASPNDRREVEDRMRREVLRVATHPEIRYEANEVASRLTGPGLFHLQIGGRLSLRGVTRSHPVEADMRLFEDGLRLTGAAPLKLSDYGIEPVTALAGAIRLRDELDVAFDLIGLPEEP